MEHHVDGMALEQARHVVVAGEITFGEARSHEMTAAGGLQLLDHVATEEARAAGDQHAGVAQRHVHRLMNSSTHSFT